MNTVQDLQTNFISSVEAKTAATNEELECLKAIYQFIEADDTVKQFRSLVEDDLALMVVRAYDCNASAAWRVLKSLQLYATKTYPDLFAKVEPEYLKPILDMNCYEILRRGSDDQGPGVICFKLKRWDTSKATTDDLIAAGVLYVYRMAKDSISVQRNGIVAVLDIDGFGFTHARHASYDVAMKIMHCLTYAAPVKMLSYVVVNSHSIFEKLYNVMKYVIPEKNRKNIFICKKNYSALHNIISTQRLPVSLGGEVPEEMAWYVGVENVICQDEDLQRIIKLLQDQFPHLLKYKPKRK